MNAPAVGGYSPSSGRTTSWVRARKSRRRFLVWRVLSAALWLGACGFDDTLVGSPPTARDPIDEEPGAHDPFPDWPNPLLPEPTPNPAEPYALPRDVFGAGSRGSAVAVHGESVYVAARDQGVVVVVSAEQLAYEREIVVGPGPEQLVVARDGTIFVAVHQANAVVRIEPGGVVSRRMEIAGGPWGIALDESNPDLPPELWVSLATGGRLVRLDHQLTKVREVFALEGTPRGVCVDGLGRVAVIAQDGKLTIIDRLLDSNKRRVADLAHAFGHLWPDGTPLERVAGTHALAVAPDPRANRFHSALGIAHLDEPIAGRAITGRLSTVIGTGTIKNASYLTFDQPADIAHHPGLALAFMVATGSGTLTLFGTNGDMSPVTTIGGLVAPRAVAVDDVGERIYVLEGSTRLVRYKLEGVMLRQRKAADIAADPLPADARLGRELFTTVARDADIACASCHVFGHSDGIAWNMRGEARQTPLRAGRIAGTAPYGWAGEHATLVSELREKFSDLGRDDARADELAALETYVTDWLVPPPRAPSETLRGLSDEGARVFRSEAAGCDVCHSGPTFSDEQLWDVGTSDAPINTPSLLDVFASAPYLHDGSAATLRDAVRRHAATLTPADEQALIAYLRSL